MSNTIVIELCAEDRARLDRLAEALERKTCDKCVKNACEYMANALKQPEEKKQSIIDNLTETAEATEAPKNAPEEAEAPTQANAPTEEEKPTVEEPATPTTEKTITHEELMATVIKLSAKDLKLKAQVRDIVLSYAPRVKAVPEDKLNECYNRLVALEG